MTTLTDLKNSIDNIFSISSTRKILQLNSNTRERAFEAYVFSLCALAVRKAGGKATLKGINTGLNPTVVVFRGSPGQMWSDAQDFCFLTCELNNKKFEVHVDVTYEGQTGANHEIDVSICAEQHANQVRKNRRAPKTNKPLIAAMECKFYDSTPGVSLVRTFIGMLRDCPSNQFNGFIANKSTGGIEKFLSKGWAKSFTDLSPLDKAAEDRFINNLEQALRQWSHTP
ncbi:hypothetical protein [Paenibacillus elgii]|uniref:hypothetical protein n=1 Tax=Paenibacillus elgii TaxID=189691 RepID=UPI000FD65E10|nr:hypothetical protein [Paenibacillus elgii]NEN84081.1 hypothetical protein [Paenibacillus elgii]